MLNFAFVVSVLDFDWNSPVLSSSQSPLGARGNHNAMEARLF